jgi:transcriptional regulator with XRE-family HTH domain
MEIGKKIREHRLLRNLNIKQLAERIECTASLISQIERGKSDPSISTLKKIAKALNVNIVDFFMSDHNEADVVTRVDERVDIELRRWDTKIQSLIKSVNRRKMQPFYTIVKPGGGSHGMYTHDGEEFGIVIKGEMELLLDDKVHVVHENESFYFSSQIPHNWNNKSRKDAVVIWVITPPTF